jgi:hypothetical protein
MMNLRRYLRRLTVLLTPLYDIKSQATQTDLTTILGENMEDAAYTRLEKDDVRRHYANALDVQ